MSSTQNGEDAFQIPILEDNEDQEAVVLGKSRSKSKSRSPNKDYRLTDESVNFSIKDQQLI